MKLSDSNRSLLAIVASMILLVCFAVWSYLRLLDSESWSLHTYRVLTEVAEVETLTGQDRGLNLCVGVGEARMIESFNWERQLDVRIQLLKLLSQDNPSQLANIVELENEITQWRNDYVWPMQQLCRQIQNGELTPDLRLIKVGLGAQHRAEIKTLLTRITDKEQLLLTERQQQAKKFRFVTSVLLLLGILGLVQLIWTFASAQLKSTRDLVSANLQLQEALRQ